MPTVIIGNSAAAVGAVEAIRQHGGDHPITIVSDEPHHVYSRPLVCHLLGGLVNETQMSYRPPDFYTRHGVECMLGVRAISINTSEQIVFLTGEGSLPYDRLLIATGGKPLIPPIPGVDHQGVFTFTKWEDAENIRRYIESRGVASALVIGGGMIGMKAVEALMARAIQVTLVELANRILSTSLDRTASQLAESILRRAGAQIRTETAVREIVGRDGRIDHAVLQDGERVACDLVIVAVGVRPNVDVALPTPENETGIEVNQGILVDAHMRTSVPNVYAAGDCTEGYDMLIGQRRPIPVWPIATRQGYIAGCHMAGLEKAYEGGFPMNSVDLCGVPAIAVGLTCPEGQDGAQDYETLEEYDRGNQTYKRLVLRENRLVGVICVGDIDRAGIYTGLIRDRVDVSLFKDHLISGSFGLISLPKEYRKHMVVGEGIVV